MDAIKHDLTDETVGYPAGEGRAARRQRRLLTRTAASTAAAVIVSVTLLTLSPLDARHLLEALLRLLHWQITAENSPPLEIPPPKSIDVTLVPKAAAPKPIVSAEKANEAGMAATASADAGASAAPTATGAASLPPAALSSPATRQAAANTGTGTAVPASKAPEKSTQGGAGATGATDTVASATQGVPPPQPVASDSPADGMQGIVVATLGEDAPISEKPGKAASDGVAAPHGLQVPALNLSLTAEAIAGLLQTGTALIVATSDDGKSQYILGTGRRFAMATIEQLAASSSRAFPVKNVTLAGAWSLALKRDDPQHSFEFALRFSNSAETTVITEQLDAVKNKGIDLAKEMAAGHVVVTDGVVDAGTLNFHIVGVSER